jgi:hypothetical protein
MGPPKTKEEALDQCEALWKNLAETGDYKKHTVALELLGYLPVSACPACEWDNAIGEGDCINCPIKAWGDDVVCTDYGTPYDSWALAVGAEDRKSYARQILQLIEESR